MDARDLDVNKMQASSLEVKKYVTTTAFLQEE